MKDAQLRICSNLVMSAEWYGSIFPKIRCHSGTDKVFLSLAFNSCRNNGVFLNLPDSLVSDSLSPPQTPVASPVSGSSSGWLCWSFCRHQLAVLYLLPTLHKTTFCLKGFLSIPRYVQPRSREVLRDEPLINKSGETVDKLFPLCLFWETILACCFCSFFGGVFMDWVISHI